MQFPDIDLNGTARQDLLEQQINAMTAIRIAITALHDASPNGRDYTPQGSTEANAKIAQALREHSDRLMRLKSVLIEIETIAEHIV